MTAGVAGLQLAEVDAPPMPELAAPGVVHDGRALPGFGLDSAQGHPDARSFRRKFGLVLPATNTTLEHELWTLVARNRRALRGVGLHATPVATPRPRFGNPQELHEYRDQFLAGLRAAAELARLARPHLLILGMSLEHVVRGLDAVRAPVARLAADPGPPWITWHDAAHAALRRLDARRIGLLTPFDAAGCDSAAALFQDLGYEVVTRFGFACAGAVDVAHVPDWAKEKAILECLAPRGHRLDAIVQCGTNMGLSEVSERLEPRTGVPILGINAVLFWHALRQGGIDAPLRGAGRLLREF